MTALRSSLCLAAAIVLAGCSSKADELRKTDKALVQAGASPDELCASARAISVAEYEEGNADDGYTYKVIADSRCLIAQMCREGVGTSCL